jgi:hypothetical protein
LGFTIKEEEGGSAMNIKPRLGPDDPLIKKAFEGIYKSSQKMHFKINPATGDHEKVGVAKALEGVDITYENKMLLVQSFPFPSLAYSSASKQALALAKVNKKRKPVRMTVADTDEADDLSDGEMEDDAFSVSGKKCQFSLVQQGLYWGCYDGREGTVVLFRTRGEAAAYIEDLLHGRDSFRTFYGKKGG